MEDSMDTEQISDTPLVSPEPAPRAADPMVTLDMGKAPLSEVLSMANPQCRGCNGKGFQDYVYQGKPESRLCGCAVRAMNRKMKGDLPVTLVGRVVKDPEAERKRVGEKVERLRAAIARREEALLESVSDHDAGIASAKEDLAKANSNMDTVQGALVAQVGYLGQLKEKAEDLRLKIEVAKSYVERINGDAILAGGVVKEKSDVLRDLCDRSNRIMAASLPERMRIDRLTAMLALYRQKHAGVLGGGE
jgi:hypothetical protein